ncbi:MAG: nickel transporter permease [Chloroflexota bacterium]
MFKPSSARRQFFRDPSTIIGLLLVSVVLILAGGANWLTTFEPDKQNLVNAFSLPGPPHLLGTDHLGRDIWSRILFGARNTLMSSFFVLLLVLSISSVVGITAGYFGNKIDSILMRLVDIFLAFPTILLAVAIAGTLGPGLFNLTLTLALVWWAGYARLIRSVVLQVRTEPYIEAALSCGVSDWRIMWKHILPNVAGPIMVFASIDFGAVILSIAGLNFLGLGVQPPDPEWGAMLNDVRRFLQTEPYLLVAPAIAIMTTVLGFNLLGDGLRDWLDPQ